MEPKLRVVPGRHYDPAEGWAREPRLRAVGEIRGPRPMSRAQADRWLDRLECLGIGFAAGVLVTFAMVLA